MFRAGLWRCLCAGFEKLQGGRQRQNRRAFPFFFFVPFGCYIVLCTSWRPSVPTGGHRPAEGVCIAPRPAGTATLIKMACTPVVARQLVTTTTMARGVEGGSGSLGEASVVITGMHLSASVLLTGLDSAVCTGPRSPGRLGHRKCR